MGLRVALLARSVAAIESLADEIGGLAIPCDVADEVAVRQAVHKSATQLGGIGIVINNAGTLEKAALSMLTGVLAVEESDALGIRVYGFLPGVADTDMKVFNRANRLNEVGNLKREALRPVTEPAQIMYFLCGPEAADLNG